MYNDDAAIIKEEKLIRFTRIVFVVIGRGCSGRPLDVDGSVFLKFTIVRHGVVREIVYRSTRQGISLVCIRKIYTVSINLQ